jgi:HTH-type transcriptional regulator / antitoxin HigA
LHGKKETFLDDFKDSTDQKEQEANLFACRTLIPDTEFARLKTLNYRRIEVIKRFSQEIGIAPAIVVGRLQHECLLPYKSYTNNLKVKLAWKHEVTGGG